MCLLYFFFLDSITFIIKSSNKFPAKSHKKKKKIENQMKSN